MTSGKSALAGFPSGSASHSAAAMMSLPSPTPLPAMAFAARSLAPGATPSGALWESPPTRVPAWVPWPWSSWRRAAADDVPPARDLPRQRRMAALHAGVDAADAHRRPGRAGRVPGLGGPDRPESPVARDSSWNEPDALASAASLTVGSRSTLATAGSAAIRRTCSGITRVEIAFTIQNPRTWGSPRRASRPGLAELRLPGRALSWLKRARRPAEQAAARLVVGDPSSCEVVELSLRITRQMADDLEAGVPCREVRMERVGDDQIALLLWASDREQWLRNVLAQAERAPLN
jgi:hypothetical protein